MRMRATLIVGALLILVAPHWAAGQGFQGGLRGAVKDPGGVVPGVEVTLTNEQTNISRTTVTNDVGEYVFSNVDPGNYKIKASLQGYKTIERTGIRVGTQQFFTLDLTMEVGAIEESVTVTGQSPIIETSNASTGTVLDTQALQTLPSAGRNAFLIGTTVPTVVPSGDAQFNRQQDQTNASLVSLGGGTRRGNNYTLDGVPVTDMRNRASMNPTIEALDDVKVQVHTYDAEMGRTGGGVFNTTLRSGTNDFHGSAFYQQRPIWGQTNNYFSELAGVPKQDTPYYLGGGSFGGPIRKDRTFFWFATEMYHDVQTRNASEIMPTAAERAGDFSQTTANGKPVIIYDPFTHLPFQGNKIPAGMINPVAANMLKYLPLPDSNVANGTENYNRTSRIINNFESEYTIKVEHKFSDKVSLTGSYLYNRTNEPCANYFGTADQSDPNRFADPNDYILVRRPKILALNNTWVLSDSSVMALRFGMTRFPDNNTLSINFDPSTLGFSPQFLNLVTVQKFPQVRVRGYDNEGRMLGAIEPNQINWKSYSANGAYSKFVGSHNFKAGADFRQMALDFLDPGNGAGYFDFDKDITSHDGLTISNPNDGNAFASYLLGWPSPNTSRQSQMSLSTPLNVYTYYYGGYLQDDWRVNSKFTLNYGLRIEHEDGLHEVNNNFTVGFDPAATLNGLTNTVTIPADPVAGTPARTVTGGLMYAGQGGAPTTQGNPPKVKWSPRVGAVYSIDPRTVVRGGYGIYWAPWNYAYPSTSSNNYGQTGYSQNTVLLQTPGAPSTSLTNPFPNGLIPPLGNSLGPLTSVGTNVSFIDQNSTAPRVQQWSVDLQRELGADQSITVSYLGARGDHLGFGGSNDVSLNLNQLDPKYQALGSKLSDRLPNPFYQNPAAGPLATQATLSRAQLLRPYPQFNDVLARHVTGARNTYSAGVIEWSKRATHGWGGRVSYTYSRLKDNQFGEGNSFVGGGTSTPLNSYNFMTNMPACTTTNLAACYNPDAEFTTSLLDVPHRLIIAPIFELPFGRGKKYGANSALAEALGDWTISAAINVQSGFPMAFIQGDNTGLLGGTQRPNVVSGVPLGTSGSLAERLASADHPSAAWVNKAAFASAPNFTFGDAPRVMDGIRTPVQANVDAVFMKNIRFGTKMAQIRIEELNLLNRVNTNANRNNIGSSNFGTIGVQRGFLRITQIMFRYQF